MPGPHTEKEVPVIAYSESVYSGMADGDDQLICRVGRKSFTKLIYDYRLRHIMLVANQLAS